ncbi:MAG: Sir2 family NAD-dependent protein deacetylase [Myxococcota bacterium]
MSLADDIERARSWIEEARHVAALTGAGISTDSGIPDFRGPQGVWTRNPDAEKMATLQIYVAEPEVRKRAWRWRLETEQNKKQPNPGHSALVDLERAGRLETLVTQNVDGLHQAAGSDPSRVVEIHGTLEEVECLNCAERAPMRRALDRVVAGEDDPPCRSCGGILKSATISFGQELVARDLRRAEDAARDCDLLLAIGSTLGVYPVAAMVPIAKESAARIVIVNAEATEMDAIADCILRGSISDILPQLVPR